MTQTYTAISVTDITNLYLYGQTTTPVDLASDAILRPHDLDFRINVDVNYYMAEGAGRFALGPQFDLVRKFFESITLSPNTSYTKAELATELGLGDSFGLAIQQYNYGDSTSDYADRVFIYNSTAFQLTDSVQFIVDSNGTKRIENYAIIPRTTVQENFDFASSDGLASFFNADLENKIDPSGIGITVNIDFTGTVSATTYTVSDYNADLATESNWTLFPQVQLTSLLAIPSELFLSGVTDFSSSGMGIVYGSPHNDTLNHTPDLEGHPYLGAGAAQNGLIYFLGAGDDYVAPGWTGLTAHFEIDGGTGTDTADFTTIDQTLRGAGGVEVKATNVEYVLGSTFGDEVEVASGAAQISGGDGADTLTGADGNDTLDGGAGNDSLAGGAGNNSISGGLGNDLLIGGSGNDTFNGGGGLDTIEGGGGRDVVIGHGGQQSLAGGDGDDIIVGGNEEPGDQETNVLSGGAGNDLIDARGVENTVEGGPGDDVIDLTQLTNPDGSTRDYHVRFHKYDGHDVLLLDGRTYMADVNDGWSWKFNTLWNTTFDFGDIDHDDMRSFVYFDDQASELYVVFEIISTGDFIVSRGVNEYWACINGFMAPDDSVIYYGDLVHGYMGFYDYFVENLATRPAQYHFQDGDFYGIYTQEVDHLDSKYLLPGLGQSVAGSAGDDAMAGTPGNDSISGADGNDVIDAGGPYSSGGVDAIDGGAGHDTLRALSNDQAIRVSGLTNVEVVTADGHSNVSLVGGGTDDLIDLSGTELVGIRLVDGSFGNDTVFGTADADTLSGGGGDDSLSAGGGDDLIMVGRYDGSDQIDGGAGLDTITATADNAIISILSISDIESIVSDGFDHVHLAFLQHEGCIDLSTVTLSGIEDISLSNGNVLFIGSSSDDVIDWRNGSDTLSGGSGNDIFQTSGREGTQDIDGGLGFDEIRATEDWTYFEFTSVQNIESIDARGFEGVSINGLDTDDVLNFSSVALIGITEIGGWGGDDTLIASSGSDHLSGYTGRDVLTGGTGADVFIYYDRLDTPVGAGRDTITDFTHGTDIIDLTYIDAKTGVAGNQAFSFIGTAAFGSVSGQLRYASVGGNTIVAGDVNGDGIGDFEIELTGSSTLSASDFLL